jgi:hypothetical protein
MGLFIFYVYAYLRADGRPYYIGKGKDRRAYQSHGWLNKPKHKDRIIFLETNLSEIGAFALERRYIRWYGRKNIDPSGILLNRAEGGEGSSGYIMSDARKKQVSEQMMGNTINTGKKLSEEHKEKIRSANKGRKCTWGHKISKKLKGKQRSESHSNNISKALKGRVGHKHTEEHIQSLKKKRWWTNGKKTVFQEVCPPNFRRGRY